MVYRPAPAKAGVLHHRSRTVSGDGRRVWHGNGGSTAPAANPGSPGNCDAGPAHRNEHANCYAHTDRTAKRHPNPHHHRHTTATTNFRAHAHPVAHLLANAKPDGITEPYTEPDTSNCAATHDTATHGDAAHPLGHADSSTTGAHKYAGQLPAAESIARTPQPVARAGQPHAGSSDRHPGGRSNTRDPNAHDSTAYPCPHCAAGVPYQTPTYRSTPGTVKHVNTSPKMGGEGSTSPRAHWGCPHEPGG